MAHILIIDDDPQVCDTLGSLVRRLDHQFATAYTLGDGLKLAHETEFDVVFLDVQLPDGNGLDALPIFTSLTKPPEVVVLTGQGDPDGAELAMQGGVWDYLTKPSGIKEIKLTLHRALKYRTEKAANVGFGTLNLDNIIGQSGPLRASFEILAQAARSDAGVLITGPTGTGKELFARTIHENSKRASNQFVVVDCAALTEFLVESTLFGHKKGSFTGAERDRVGLVKLANGGTLFLDEVGEMPLSIQKTFLRVLQERRFRPVGDTKEITSDFRLISATNRDPAAMVAEGKFREDLYFRLKSISINLPPLTNRGEDIRSLALHFASKLCIKYNVPPKGFDPNFLSVLGCYHWPGNVRELQNVLDRAFADAGTERILYPKHLPSELRAAVARSQMADSSCAEASQSPSSLPQLHDLQADLGKETPPPLKSFKGMAERQYLSMLLAKYPEDIKSILEISGLSRSHFYALLKKHGLSD